MKGLFLIFLFISNLIFAQVPLKFQPVFGTDELQKENFFGEDSLQINRLKFYLSEFSLYKNGNCIWTDPNSFYLFDLEKGINSYTLNARAAEFDSIEFSLGIDSIINVSGAIGGVLDPVHGMYWSWQSGYINLKLEGRSLKCRTRNNQFTYHLGGYQYPYETKQKIKLPVADLKKIFIYIDLKSFFESIQIDTVNHVMSPGLLSSQLSVKIARIFSIGQQ